MALARIVTIMSTVLLAASVSALKVMTACVWLARNGKTGRVGLVAVVSAIQRVRIPARSVRSATTLSAAVLVVSVFVIQTVQARLSARARNVTITQPVIPVVNRFVIPNAVMVVVKAICAIPTKPVPPVANVSVPPVVTKTVCQVRSGIARRGLVAAASVIPLAVAVV